MSESKRNRIGLGDEPPLSGDGRSGPPDRREVSARWLIGTFLTGVTSSVLMGVALSAALNGREQLATPPELARMAEIGHGAGEDAKTERLVPPQTVARPTDRQRLEVSTVIKSGDREVVRTQPFVRVSMTLSAGYTTNKDYPDFNAQALFANDDDDNEQTANTGLIYGAKVENEVSLKTGAFPLENANYDTKTAMSADEVEKLVRNTAAILTDGDVEVASLHYVDPQRFGETLSTQALAAYGVKIVQENVSVSPRDAADETAAEFAEDMIVFDTDKKIADALEQAGYDGPDATGMAEAVGKLMSTDTLKAGTMMRLGIETHGGEASRIMRASVYSGSSHVLTIALNDDDQYVPAEEPEPNPDLMAAYEHTPLPRERSDLPRIYDGIYRASYTYGLTQDLTKQVIKVLAPSVDYQSRLGTTDRLEVMFSQPGPDNKATDDSQLLYLKADIGSLSKAYYRFQMGDGSVDYFDSDGRSSRQFLIRNPMPGARFSRGFGMQRHPILGYSRMHTGDDWAIARGTPIRAAGSGVIEKAGWAGGYGRHTVIRHANGYETVYGHQSAIAKGIKPGVHVRQGQIIGYVGSTGLSTGPHLHYEIRVNGKPVDPLRVRLPEGKALKGKELEAFDRERDRTDKLLQDNQRGDMTVASTR